MSAVGDGESEVHVVLRRPQQDPEPTEARQLVDDVCDEPPVGLVEPVEVVEPVELELVGCGCGGRECTCALTITAGITVTTYLVGLLLSAAAQDRYTMAFATLAGPAFVFALVICLYARTDVCHHSGGLQCLGSGLIVLSLLWTALPFAFFVVSDFRGHKIGR
jgi:hypothetical protein